MSYFYVSILAQSKFMDATLSGPKMLEYIYLSWEVRVVLPEPLGPSMKIAFIMIKISTFQLID